MAGYVPRLGGNKKKGILAKREDALRHSLKNDKPKVKVKLCAERVRDAQLAIIKTLLYETDPATSEEHHHDAQRANLIKSRAYWEDMPANEIVALYESEE